MKPSKKLDYLRRYMDRWIEHYPNYKLCSFEVFVSLEEQKRRKNIKIERAKLEASRIKTSNKRICQYCERRLNHPTKDHIIPKSKGGTNSITNIIKCCHRCNQWKGSKDLSAWLVEVLDCLVMDRGPKGYGGYKRQEIENIMINIRKVQQQTYKVA